MVYTTIQIKCCYNHNQAAFQFIPILNHTYLVWINHLRIVDIEYVDNNKLIYDLSVDNSYYNNPIL